MDVSEPGAGLASGLTMPVLRALAGRSTPMTAAQLARVADRGTEAGLKRAADRLARHGVVRTQVIGDRTVYSLNHDHVLWPAVSELLNVDGAVAKRTRAALRAWDIAPISAALYGSAARRDGDEASDIDLLLVTPALASARRRQQWAAQVHGLRDQVGRWTGNRLHVLERSRPDLARLGRSGEPVVDEWRRDATTLAGQNVRDLLSELA